MVEFFFLVEGEVRCSDRERLGWSTIGIGERNSEAKKKERPLWILDEGGVESRGGGKKRLSGRGWEGESSTSRDYV